MRATSCVSCPAASASAISRCRWGSESIQSAKSILNRAIRAGPQRRSSTASSFQPPSVSRSSRLLMSIRFRRWHQGDDTSRTLARQPTRRPSRTRLTPNCARALAYARLSRPSLGEPMKRCPSVRDGFSDALFAGLGIEVAEGNTSVPTNRWQQLEEPGVPGRLVVRGFSRRRVSKFFGNGDHGAISFQVETAPRRERSCVRNMDRSRTCESRESDGLGARQLKKVSAEIG